MNSTKNKALVFRIQREKENKRELTKEISKAISKSKYLISIKLKAIFVVEIDEKWTQERGNENIRLWRFIKLFSAQIFSKDFSIIKKKIVV